MCFTHCICIIRKMFPSGCTVGFTVFPIYTSTWPVRGNALTSYEKKASCGCTSMMSPRLISWTLKKIRIKSIKIISSFFRTSSEHSREKIKLNQRMVSRSIRWRRIRIIKGKGNWASKYSTKWRIVNVNNQSKVRKWWEKYRVTNGKNHKSKIWVAL